MSRISIAPKRLNSIFYYVPHIIISDRNYWMLDIEYLTGDGYDAYKKWLLSFTDVLNWKRLFDCEQFAQSYQLYMQCVHFQYNQGNIKAAEGVAVGVCYYTKEEGGSHAINVAIQPDPLFEYKKVYIEPQTGHIIQLTYQEEDSIWYAMF